MIINLTSGDLVIADYTYVFEKNASEKFKFRLGFIVQTKNRLTTPCEFLAFAQFFRKDLLEKSITQIQSTDIKYTSLTLNLIKDHENPENIKSETGISLIEDIRLPIKLPISGVYGSIKETALPSKQAFNFIHILRGNTIPYKFQVRGIPQFLSEFDKKSNDRPDKAAERARESVARSNKIFDTPIYFADDVTYVYVRMIGKELDPKNVLFAGVVESTPLGIAEAPLRGRKLKPVVKNTPKPKNKKPVPKKR